MASKNKNFDRTSAATAALKRSIRFFACVVIVLGLISVGISRLFTEDVVIRAQETARENLNILWQSYRHYYIRDGQVMRPKNDFDTVSEGQAYAMLRACWQADRDTFDAVYRWTEQNLSRVQSHGDHLLSWRFGSDSMGGQAILDDNPALDADLDYALALFLAGRIWPDGRSPLGTMAYREKALAVADSIMSRAVHLHPNGELVLLPWPLTGSRDPERDLMLNPSYFSPGHYRIFEEETGNRRWSKLAGDTYRQIDRLLAAPLGDANRVVTVPDWIAMRPDGTFVTDASRGYVSGWDAFRLWWRLRLDWEISGNLKAEELIRTRLLPFLGRSMDQAGGDVASESERDGTPIVKNSNAGMAAVYRWATRDFDPTVSRALERQALRHLQRDGGFMFFQDKDDYYTNSWAWFAMLEGGSNYPFAGLYRLGRSAAPTEETP